MKTPRTPPSARHAPLLDASVWPRHPEWYRVMLASFAIALCAGSWSAARAADHAAATDHAAKPVASAQKIAPKKTAASEAEGSDIAVDLKKALKDNLIDRKKLTLVITDKPEAPAKTAGKAAPAAEAHAAPATPVVPAVARPMAAAARPAAHAPAINPRASRDYIKARAAALTGHEGTAQVRDNSGHGGEVHWSYSGETGPQAWGKLKPEFNVCAIGKRQSPINIEDTGTLQGPAEPLQFNYNPSNAIVTNNGHTIQVDLQGNNTLTVRGSTYTLLQFHFHTPSEEQINYRNYAMVVHLVHKNSEGQLAVVAVLLDPGVANPLIDKVWTYMPLDVSDRVRMPAELVNMNELLPKDQRYYQFMGSLTTPPCTEGVLWMVLKQPTQISKEQLRLFQQLYPSNARPVQPVNSRPVRNAQ